MLCSIWYVYDMNGLKMHSKLCASYSNLLLIFFAINVISFINKDKLEHALFLTKNYLNFWKTGYVCRYFAGIHSTTSSSVCCKHCTLRLFYWPKICNILIFIQGFVYYKMNNYVMSEKVLREAINIDPTLHLSWWDLSCNSSFICYVTF